MIEIGEFLESYLTKGYYHFNASDVVSKFNITAFEPLKNKDRTFPNDSPEERYSPYTFLQMTFLKQLSWNLSANYFRHFVHEFRFNDMWGTANENTYDWHTDTMRCWRGFNSSLNCYFDDMDEEHGGAFQVKPVTNGFVDDSEYTSTIYPKKFDVIVINQAPGFVHRVTHTDKPRRMVAFAAIFEDFNHV